MSHEEIAANIFRFLASHAKTAADFDPAFDQDADRYSSPDAALLHAAAERIAVGQMPDRVMSSWESGGFTPYTDRAARAWHDNLVGLVNGLQPDFRVR